MSTRLRIRVKDLMTYSRRSLKFTFLGVIKACGWGLVFSWKSRSILLLNICIKHSIIGFLNNIKIFISTTGENIN
jgi:hypothetical protein